MLDTQFNSFQNYQGQLELTKKFIDMTRDDVLSYLDKSRKPENEDPLHKWIGSYNIRCVILFRFFKWLYYPNVTNPEEKK